MTIEDDAARIEQKASVRAHDLTGRALAKIMITALREELHPVNNAPEPIRVSGHITGFSESGPHPLLDSGLLHVEIDPRDWPEHWMLPQRIVIEGPAAPAQPPNCWKDVIDYANSLGINKLEPWQEGLIRWTLEQ